MIFIEVDLAKHERCHSGRRSHQQKRMICPKKKNQASNTHRWKVVAKSSIEACQKAMPIMVAGPSES